MEEIKLTNWRKAYEEKLTTAEEVVHLVKDGDFMAFAGGANYPKLFDQALSRHLLAKNYHIGLYTQFLIEDQALFNRELKDYVDIFDIFLSAERKYAANGNLNLIPVNIGKNGEVIQYRKPRIVAMTCSPPDEEGWMSRSLWAPHLHRDNFEDPACEIVIVEVNKNMPFVRSTGDKHCLIHVSEVDYILEADYLWPEVKSIESTEVEKSIAGYCADLIEDGSCLQLGIGGLADAIGFDLVHSNKKDLGLHSEVMSNCFAELIKAGVINNSRKQLAKGKSCFGYVIGDRNLWDFCREEKNLCQKEIDWVNDPYNISQNHNVVSINGVLEMDLLGQAASEAIGRKQYSATGGQLQWVFGSQRSPGGKSILALNSTYVDKQGVMRSKIKGCLEAGSIITTPRTLTQYVVTEYGAADLKYKSVKERAEALVRIAHPDFRDELRFEAAKLR